VSAIFFSLYRRLYPLKTTGWWKSPNSENHSSSAAGSILLIADIGTRSRYRGGIDYGIDFTLTAACPRAERACLMLPLFYFIATAMII
jgi:hypothetical protein